MDWSASFSLAARKNATETVALQSHAKAPKTQRDAKIGRSYGR